MDYDPGLDPTAKPPQRWLDIMSDAIREDLLEPNGVHAPFVPIIYESPIGLFLYGRDGATNFEAEDDEAPKPDAKANLIQVSSAFNALQTAGILAHEMVHTAFPYGAGGEDGHGEPFASIVKKIGLVGPPTQTRVGVRFKRWFDERLAPKLAPFPRYGTR